MLAKLKEYISNLPDISFDEYYMDYIFSVQDDNLQREFKHLKFQRDYNLQTIQGLINFTAKEVRIYDTIINSSGCIQ